MGEGGGGRVTGRTQGVELISTQKGTTLFMLEVHKRAQGFYELKL